MKYPSSCPPNSRTSGSVDNKSLTKKSSSRPPFIFFTIVAALVFLFTLPPRSSLGLAASQYTVSLDRSAIPSLNYRDVTLRVAVGNVSNIQLLQGGTHSLPYSYDASSGILSFTTDGNSVNMALSGPDADSFNGQVTIAPLKNGKLFAWSHSMDDNVFLENSVAAFDSFNYRATIYAIGDKISDTRNESWILDKINIHDLLGKGWAIGNHTYSHGCYGTFYSAEIINGYNRLVQLIPDSPKPNYVINSFAAPCFDSNYHPYILQHRDAGTTTVLMNESGNKELLVVDPGASNYSSSGRTAQSFNFDMEIGRGNAIELGNTSEAKSIIDWMATHANSTRHFWYNTFSHDSKEAYLSNVMSHIYNNYGAAGNQKIWVAPAEEIYSYLLVRDRINVSTSPGDSTNGGGGSPTATPTFTPTPSPTPVPPTATPNSSSGASRSIYSDSLAAGWGSGSWGDVAHQPVNSTQSYAGAASFSLKYNAAWSTLYFNQSQPIDATEYDRISFWVRGASNGSSSIRLSIMNSAYVTSNKITLNNLSPGWQNVSIPLSDFGTVTDIFYLLWENPKGSAQPTIYLDEILLESGNGGPPPVAPTNTPTSVPTSTPTNTPTDVPNQPNPTNTPMPLPPTATNTPTNTPTSTPTAPASSVDGLEIYDDSLAGGWNRGTWGNINHSLSNSSPVHDGSASISVKYNESWGTLYLLANQALDADDYSSLSFWVYGNSGGSSSLAVSVMNSSYQTSFRARFDNLDAGWQFVHIPLANLGPLTDILYILIDNPNTSGQPIIFMDELVLEDAAGSSQVTAAAFSSNASITSTTPSSRRASALFYVEKESAGPAPVVNGLQSQPMIDLSTNQADTELPAQPQLEPMIFLPLAIQ